MRIFFGGRIRNFSYLWIREIKDISDLFFFSDFTHSQYIFAGLATNKLDVSRSRITAFIPVSEYEAVGLGRCDQHKSSVRFTLISHEVMIGNPR